MKSLFKIFTLHLSINNIKSPKPCSADDADVIRVTSIVSVTVKTFSWSRCPIIRQSQWLEDRIALMHVLLTMLELKLIPFQRHPDTCDATVSHCEAGLIGTTELIINNILQYCRLYSSGKKLVTASVLTTIYM